MKFFIFLFFAIQAQAEIQWTFSEEAQSGQQGTARAGASPVKMTSQDLQATGLTPLQATDLIPSLQIQGSELGGTTPTVFLRGSPSDEVLILWNGIELNDPAAAGGGASPLLIQREFSHQLSVTTGPQTLREGPRALAGVLNWQKSSAVSSRAIVSAGTLQNQAGTFEYQKKNRQSSWGFGGSSSRAQGLSVSSDPSYDEKDAQSKATGSAFYEGELSENTKVEAWGLFSSVENDDDLFGAQDPDARSSHRMQAGRVTLIQQYSVKDQIRFEVQSVQSQRENRNDPVTATLGYLDKTSGERLKQSLDWDREEAQFNFTFHLDTTQESMWGTSQSSSPQTGFDQRQTEQGTAAIISSADKNTKLGFRFDRAQIYADQAQTASSWQIFHRGDAIKDLFQPFISISEGHRFPTLYQRFSSYGNSSLQSQTLREYEVGIEGFFQTSTAFSTSLFRDDYTQMIDYDLTTSKYQNWGRTQILGLELNLSRQVFLETWTWGFVYLQTRDQILDRKLLRRPDYSSSLLWTHQLSDVWSSTLGLHWMGSRLDQDLSGTVDLAPSWKSRLGFQYRPISSLKWNFQFENIFNSSSPEVATYNVVPRSAVLTLEYSF